MATEEKKVITVSGVLADLSAGLDRKAIKEKYNITNKELAHLFQHPQLKNRKVKTPFSLSFELVDDVTKPENDGNNIHEGAAPLS